MWDPKKLSELMGKTEEKTDPKEEAAKGIKRAEEIARLYRERKAQAKKEKDKT
jgi:hypothetical protein